MEQVARADACDLQSSAILTADGDEFVASISCLQEQECITWESKSGRLPKAQSTSVQPVMPDVMHGYSSLAPSINGGFSSMCSPCS